MKIIRTFKIIRRQYRFFVIYTFIADQKTAEDLLVENAELKAKLEVAIAALNNEEARRRDLEHQISLLLNKQFSSSSEKVSVEQLELMLEGLSDAKAKPEITEAPEKKKHYKSRKTEFPEDLPADAVVVKVADKDLVCPDTGKSREVFKYEESVKFDWVPGHFKKIVILREVRTAKYTESDPLPSEPIVTAEMPEEYRVIPGCFAGINLLVHILVSKYCDHLPLYRQQSIFEKRHNVKIDRTLMGHWLKQLAISLAILYEALRVELMESGYLQIDETFIKLLDPERKGKARQAYFWVIRHPTLGVLFQFDHRRDGEVPLDMIPGYKGKLQSDGYSVYESLLKARPDNAARALTIVLFNCWAHARRKVKESVEVNGSDAAWYLAKIRALYAIERDARDAGFTSKQREQLRRERSRSILTEIKAELDKDESNARILPSSPLGKALNYMRNRWEYLEAYAQDGNGEVEIDNNFVENSIRPTAIGKKNWLFIGHPKAGQTSAIIYTIIENCRMHSIDPFSYLVDVLPRIQDYPANRINELLPRQWAKRRDGCDNEVEAA